MKAFRLALAVAVASLACAPSAKKHQSMQARLSALEAEQQRLQAQLDAVAAEQRRASSDLDQAEIERRRTRSVADNLATRVAALEGGGPPPSVAEGSSHRPNPAVHYKVLIGDAHVRGPDTALVTIVEWADFQCPFCARVQATLEALETKYEGRVRFVFKHNPLPMHDRAMAAAIAAEAAGRQGKFWQMHDLLFADPKTLTDAQFVKYAKKLGLNRRKFKRDLADAALKAKIEAQQQQGARIGARGTPAFFINGRFLSGAQPVESFSALIDEELASAQARVENGTRTTDVYDAIMAEARSELTRP